MKKILFFFLIVFSQNAYSQDRTCYVVYNHELNNKKIYIDEVPTSELAKYKYDHLNGNIEETKGWFINRQRLYKKDFAELKDNIDSKLDADYFVISLVSNINMPNGYEIKLASHLKKYEREIKDAINRKRYSNIETDFNRLQGNTGTQMFLKEYEGLLKDKRFEDKRFELLQSEVVVQGFDSERTIAKVDFVAKMHNSDDLVFIEVKTGNASLSKNQQIVYSKACSEGVILRSNKEIKGYSKGATIKPLKVLEYREGTYKSISCQ